MLASAQQEQESGRCACLASESCRSVSLSLPHGVSRGGHAVSACEYNAALAIVMPAKMPVIDVIHSSASSPHPASAAIASPANSICATATPGERFARQWETPLLLHTTHACDLFSRKGLL